MLLVAAGAVVAGGGPPPVCGLVRPGSLKLFEVVVEERRSGPGRFPHKLKPTGLARNSLTRGRCARYPEGAAANRTSSFFVDRHLRCVETIDFAIPFAAFPPS